MWYVGTLVSLAIFALVYFTVIRPSTETANQAIKTGLQQSQQVINQTQKQLGSAAAAAGATSSQAQKALGNAQKLTACVAAAGTNVSAIGSCHTKFGN
jgi:hypothetical protein